MPRKSQRLMRSNRTRLVHGLAKGAVPMLILAGHAGSPVVVQLQDDLTGKVTRTPGNGLGEQAYPCQTVNNASASQTNGSGCGDCTGCDIGCADDK